MTDLSQGIVVSTLMVTGVTLGTLIFDPRQEGVFEALSRWRNNERFYVACAYIVLLAFCFSIGSMPRGKEVSMAWSAFLLCLTMVAPYLCASVERYEDEELDRKLMAQAALLRAKEAERERELAEERRLRSEIARETCRAIMAAQNLWVLENCTHDVEYRNALVEKRFSKIPYYDMSDLEVFEMAIYAYGEKLGEEELRQYYARQSEIKSMIV